jgi:hypothetical protein
MTARPPGSRAPAIVVCSAHPDRLAAVVAQLGERYAAHYSIRPVESSAGAAEALQAISDDGGQVAVLLADDAGTLDDGRTVFQLANDLFPDARRGLLVEWGAWGDRDTADLVLGLMAQGQVDYYVIRPWHQPDEYFHRTVTEFLVEWDRAIGLRPREVSVVGDPARGAPDAGVQRHPAPLRRGRHRGGERAARHGRARPGAADGRAAPRRAGAGRPHRPRPASTRRRRGCGASSSSGRRSAARPRRARSSATTWVSPGASPALS